MVFEIEICPQYSVLKFGPSERDINGYFCSIVLKPISVEVKTLLTSDINIEHSFLKDAYAHEIF